MFPSRVLGLYAFGTAAAAVLFACTLTQSLDYLQKGDGGTVVGDGGIDPNVDGGGEAGGRVPLWQVTSQTKPGFLALDAQNVYWIADGKILTVPKATGGMPKLLGTVPPNASGLAVDGDPAGFAFVAVGTNVLRVAKDGSNATASVTVFNPGAGATIADTIGADQSSLFVLQYDQNGAGVDTRILRMAKDGGVPTDISGDGGATTMTLDPTDLFWLSADPDKSAFIEHAKTAPAGTDVAVLALGTDDDLPTFSSEIAVDATNLYWLTTNAASTNAVIVSRKRQPSASAVTNLSRHSGGYARAHRARRHLRLRARHARRATVPRGEDRRHAREPAHGPPAADVARGRRQRDLRGGRGARYERSDHEDRALATRH